MKNYKTILLLSLFCASLVQSCTKEGGALDGPAGNNVYSTLSYTNTTFTPIYITVNGTSKWIPVAATVSFTSIAGSGVAVAAVTSGTNYSGARIGEKIVWEFNSSYPASGSYNQNLFANNTVFFLKIINNSPTFYINGLYVNYGLLSQSYDNNFVIPNDGATYFMGYYKAYTNSNVRMENGSIYWYWDYLNLPFTTNQSITLTAN